MGDYRERVFDEVSELSNRVDKLTNFIVSDKYDALPEVDKSDLKEQLKHMKGYYKVLLRRASRMCGNA